MSIADPGLNPEMNEERKEERERRRRIFDACSQDLSERERKLLGCHLEGLTNREIAKKWCEDVKMINVEWNALMAKMRYRCRRKNRNQGGQ